MFNDRIAQISQITLLCLLFPAVKHIRNTATRSRLHHFIKLHVLCEKPTRKRRFLEERVIFIIMNEIIKKTEILHKQGQRHRGGRGAWLPPLVCVAKRKNGDKGKKERVSKQKLSKGCHQGQNIIVLAILERLEFKNFSCRPTIVADNTFQCSMAPPL